MSNSKEVASARTTAQTGVARDLTILQALASPEARETRGLGVAQLADQIERHKSQVSRALRALDEAGLVTRDPDTRRYRLGWQLFALTADTDEAQLLRASRAPMESLCADIDEDVHLCVLDDTEVLTVVSVFRSSRTPSYLAAPRVPAHCTSAGRVLLSDYTRTRLEKRFRDVAFPAAAPSSLVRNVDGLYQQIQHVRTTGYATVDEEFKPHLVGASAPVQNAAGRIIAAINISAAKDHLTDLDHIGRAAATTASALSRSLGWSPRPSFSLGLS